MIYLGNDHGGYDLKRMIVGYLQKNKQAFVDMGCDGEKSVDFPTFAKLVCEKVLEDESNKGILVCGSGLGVSMAANRHKGIRAALIPPGECSSEYAKLSRQHNDANVICLGGRFIRWEDALVAVEIFLNTEHLKDPKYKKRMDMLDEDTAGGGA